MTDTAPAAEPHAPAWFTVAALLALLWEAFGCFMFYSQVTTDITTLPLDQRAIWAATPTWSIAAYGTAVGLGLLGAVMLLMKRRAAVQLLGVSFLAVILQFSALVLVPKISGMISSDMLLMPLGIALVCYGILHLALLASKRGWLR